MSRCISCAHISGLDVLHVACVKLIDHVFSLSHISRLTKLLLAHLTAKLTGWKIDIQKEESDVTFEEKVAMAVASMAAVKGIGREHAVTLVKAGFLTVEGILAAEVAELAETTGLDLAAAQLVYEAAAAQTEATAPKS